MTEEKDKLPSKDKSYWEGGREKAYVDPPVSINPPNMPEADSEQADD
jgi:hypothetical protein